MRDTRRGYIYAIGSSLSAGAIPALSKGLLSGGMKPLLISGIVFALAGLVLLPYKPKVFLNRRSAKWMVASGLIGSALAPAVYLFGVSQTSAVNASLLANTEVFFTVLIAVIIFRESLKQSQILEGLLVIFGVLVVSTNLEFSGATLLQGLAGNLLVIAASFVWAVDNNISRVTSQRFGPLLVSKFRNLIGGATVLGFLFVTSQPFVVPSGSLPFLAGFVIAAVSATMFFMESLVRIGVVRTLLVFSSSSIFGSLFAVALLGETITLVQLAGGALIISGVYLIQRSEDVTSKGSNS